MRGESWSKSQKKHARELFDLALEREYKELIEEINTTKITSRDEVWELRDRLNQKAKEMDRRYDYRYSQLIFVFADLLREGYLSLEELNVLGEEKLDDIKKWSGVSE
ncbi:MAG: hypothetical protein J7J02_03040 [Sulfurovum sp.]|nr:hypothetical protein [Sulfurovum sp.]